MNKDNLIQIQEMHYDDIKHDALVDVNEIHIDTEQEISERLEQFINEVKNPYIMKCGKTIVEIEFTDTTKTIECQIINYLNSVKTSDLP